MLNFKTKRAAINHIRAYNVAGVVWQYPKTGRWGWATEGSGCWSDLRRRGVLAPGLRGGGVRVENIEWVA